MLKCRLPPRVFELTRDLLFGHVPHRKIEEQRLKAQGCQFASQARAFHEVLEHLRLGCQPREGAHEGLHRQRCQRLRTRTPENGIQLAELGIHPLPGNRDIGKAERDVGNDVRLDVALPLLTLLLDTKKRLVHVADVHAGAHVFAGEAPKPAAIGAAERRRVASRGVSLNQVADRPFEYGRAEAVEGVSDALQQPQVLAEFADTLERAHVGLPQQDVSPLQQMRKVHAVELAGQRVR